MEESSLDKLKKLLESSKKGINDFDPKIEEDKFNDINFFLSKEKKITDELRKQIKIIGKSQNIIGCDSTNSKDVLVSLIKLAFSEGKTPVVVLTSTNYKQIFKLFAENKINQDDLYLIDTVSKAISRVKDEDKLFFVDSLRNLTQIQIRLIKIIQENNASMIDVSKNFNQKDFNDNKLFLIFDSTDVLMLYHDDQIILKFVYSLTKLLHKYFVPSFFISSNKKMLPRLTQFFDDFVELEKM